MSGIVVFLIVAITLHVTYNAIFNGAYSRELGIVTLGASLLLTDNTIVAIILVSALTTLIISSLDEETVTLFLLGVTGLIVLSGTDSLLILFLSIELVGLTFYILAARERKGVRSTEAGVKYFVLGALSSGILLLGMSLAYATTGTTSLEMVTGASATMIKIGLLFKLGAAPFHMWLPDVYEGSPIIITIFFAAVPKIAYMTVLMRLVVSGPDSLILLSGILSIIVGSIGALNQTKLKRMLAYSAIGHTGFMLIGVGVATFASYQATIVYMVVYIIMTINIFTLIMELGLQKIVEVRGLSRRNGIAAITLGLSLLSIAGIPPLAGFYNKFLIIVTAVEASQITVAITAVLLSVISSYYYVRIIRWMYFEDAPEITVILPKFNYRSSLVIGATTFGIFSIMLYPSIVLGITSPIVFLV